MRNVISNMEKVEISKAANVFCCIVKQAESVAHKMRYGINHFKLRAKRHPCFIVQAVEKISDVFFICEIALSFKVNCFLSEWCWWAKSWKRQKYLRKWLLGSHHTTHIITISYSKHRHIGNVGKDDRVMCSLSLRRQYNEKIKERKKTRLKNFFLH